ncbi:MAG TPA: hypothetical protein VF916_02070, partial [Ktedonobacterales bacterium]
RLILRTALLRDAQSERATPGGRDSTPLPAPLGREAQAASGDAPTPLRFFKALQRGDARLVVRTALGHVFVGLAVAIAASGILLAGDELGYWLLGMAAITVCGGTAGYALLALRRTPTLGALALILAQLGALAVLFLAIGAQVAALLLVPAAGYLAFRMGGRVVAFVSGIGAVAVYGGVAVVFASGLSAPPPVTLPGEAQALFDGVAAVVGIGLLLAVLVTIVDTRARSEAAARARLYELRLVRARMTGFRARAEEDGQVLETALTSALRGRGIEPITADGALSPVAEAVNAVADRLETLQKDREDRLRLEGALRTVVRTMERGWLGLPWSWPEPSGTMLDELIVLLRTPRPQERSTPAVWPDETPTFVPRPKAGGGTEQLDPHTNPGISRALPERSNAWYRR